MLHYADFRLILGGFLTILFPFFINFLFLIVEDIFVYQWMQIFKLHKLSYHWTFYDKRVEKRLSLKFEPVQLFLN